MGNVPCRIRNPGTMFKFDKNHLEPTQKKILDPWMHVFEGAEAAWKKMWWQEANGNGGHTPGKNKPKCLAQTSLWNHLVSSKDKFVFPLITPLKKVLKKKRARGEREKGEEKQGENYRKRTHTTLAALRGECRHLLINEKKVPLELSYSGYIWVRFELCLAVSTGMLRTTSTGPAHWWGIFRANLIKLAIQSIRKSLNSDVGCLTIMGRLTAQL